MLVGKPASEFSVPEKALILEPPAIPAGLPSDLLERRPDVAEAERLMASANAQIGVARAAYFPVAEFDRQPPAILSDDLVKLFNVSSTIWSVAAGASQPLYAGGQHFGESTFARARLTTNRWPTTASKCWWLSKKLKMDSRAFAFSRSKRPRRIRPWNHRGGRSTISTARYKEGLANFLEVIDAERTVLENDQESAQLRELRLLTTVQFIQALGGGWQESKIYSDSQAPATGSSQPSH